MALTVFSSSQLHRRTRRFTQRFLRPKALASEAERPILKGTVVCGTVLPKRSIWYQNASLHDVHFSVCLCAKSTPNIFRILGYFRYSYEHILFSVKFAWNASVERLPTFCLLHSNRLNMSWGTLLHLIFLLSFRQNCLEHAEVYPCMETRYSCCASTPNE